MTGGRRAACGAHGRAVRRADGRPAALPGPLADEVLAAGHGRGHGPVREADCAAWESQLRVNLLAPMILTRRLLPELDATDGDLVLVGCLFGTRPSPGYAAYAATKHGLAGFVRSLAEEDRSADGCRICLISSGATNTEFASVLARAATRASTRSPTGPTIRCSPRTWRPPPSGR
ncbi:SDR family NAD(P)-dependent oxidoreductase [Kitasatospora aureofaciens]|uniref:SDR family NAD(P)-dependent oxidoreductase n=1 Tax=Kitasatospora aureofaciens TaxID=1894 RepID=UPI0036F4663A